MKKNEGKKVKSEKEEKKNGKKNYKTPPSKNSGNFFFGSNVPSSSPKAAQPRRPIY